MPDIPKAIKIYTTNTMRVLVKRPHKRSTNGAKYNVSINKVLKIMFTLANLLF
jgi:hypothetical protein